MGAANSFITEWDNAPKVVTEFERKTTPEAARAAFRSLMAHQIPNTDDYSWACREAAKVINLLPNLIEIDPPPTDRYILVGDMHGCFETLIRLFEGDAESGIPPTGYPSDIVDGKRNVYIFNGDLVDRGGSGYQIVFALSLLVVAYPDCVYINRGNHESEMFGLSTQGGIGNKYMLEVAGKFPEQDFSAFKPATCDLFYSLPIAILLDKRILIVHGGVPSSNDVSGTRTTTSLYSPTIQTSPQVPKNSKPYDISQLRNLTPPRQQTYNFEDTPRRNADLWHSFLWSYDRLPYSADFMEANGLRSMVHSHTATPYHQITTMLPVDGQAEKYAIQSIVKSDEMFDRAKSFFETHKHANDSKYCIMEIFSSPTNSGNVYASILEVQDSTSEYGEKLDPDPFNWEYVFLGSANDFRFIVNQ